VTLHLKLYSDGGARGNPGPAAIAFLAQDQTGKIVKEDTQYIGVHTNNEAEYEALLLGLVYAQSVNAQEISCYLDSELVVKQLNGEYAVKKPELQVYARKVREMKSAFKKVTFYNIRRSQAQITRADELVNQTLDKQNLKGNSTLVTKTSEGSSLFVHVSIRTSNMERSIVFYNRYFGLKVQRRHDIKETNSQIAFLQDPAGKGCILELTFYQNQKEFIQANYEERLFDHLGFEVANINQTIAEMKNAGITITDEPYKFSEHTTIAFIEDPDGTLIELIERK
jgi:lactoylglutathione lyase